jgi:hypothetical protein
MDERYEIARVGDAFTGPGLTVGVFTQRLTSKLRTVEAPYERRVAPDGTWGGPHANPREMAEFVAHEHARLPVGTVVKVRGAEREGRRFRTIRRLVLEGPFVYQAALSQLGVDYSWADENPEGPAGGTGAGFDCSGLTRWCYLQVGVSLPHSAEAQRTDPRVLNFDDRRDVLPGDLVFYRAGRLPAPMADHVGIAGEAGWVVDASSSADAVVHRAIDANPIIGYGRLVEVNGRL